MPPARPFQLVALLALAGCQAAPETAPAPGALVPETAATDPIEEDLVGSTRRCGRRRRDRASGARR